MNRLLLDIRSARNVVPPLSPRRVGWLLAVLQANLKINATSSARLFLILPSFLPQPHHRHHYFLSQTHISSLPSAFSMLQLFYLLVSLGFAWVWGGGRDVVDCFVLCCIFST